jgi:hypothetical protein
LKEEDRKDEVIKVNEEERSCEEEVIRRMMMTTEEKSMRRRELGRVRTSLPLSLLPLSHPHYLSPYFLPVILTTSPSFFPFIPPLHY